MTIEYEHKGVIYHEPLPRIVLVECAVDTLTALTKDSHNTKVAYLRQTRPDSVATHLAPPTPPHEIDILIVRDTERSVVLPAISSIGQPSQSLVSKFSNQVVWPSGFQEDFQSFCRTILQRGGVCVFLLPETHGGLLEHAGLGLIPQPSKKLWPKTAYSFASREHFPALVDFVERFVKSTNAYVALASSGSLPWPIHPLLTDEAGTMYAVAFEVPPAGGTTPGLSICLPAYSPEGPPLKALLLDVLPSFFPDLFPFRHDLSWLKAPDFRHPDALALETQKAEIEEKTRRDLQAIDQNIDEIETKEMFLRDLLTTAGDQLKGAVRKALEFLLAAAGVSGVPVLDVDSDSSLRGESSDKREDLRIEWDGRFFLIDVAGREQYLRPTSLNQLEKNNRLFLKASSGVAVDRVHSFLIANFNYAGGLDPRKRGEMFGTGTVEARDRLIAAGHGAMTTFDLFRLIRLIQRLQLSFNQGMLLRLLRTEGVLDLDSLLRTPQ